MINETDIEAMQPEQLGASIDAARSGIKKDLERVQRVPTHMEFTASGLHEFLKNVRTVLAYSVLQDGIIEALSEQIDETERLARLSMAMDGEEI